MTTSNSTRRKVRILLALVVSLAVSLSAVRAQSAGAVLFVPFEPGAARFSIWRVSADGSARKLLEFEQDLDAAMCYGSTRPEPSPNQEWLALIEKNDLWLLNIATGSRLRVTQVGKQSDERFASVLVRIVGWFPEGDGVLFYVTHGLLEDVEGEREDLLIRPEAYGFYLYDLNTSSKAQVTIPYCVESLLPSRQLLVRNEDSWYGPLLRYAPRTGGLEGIAEGGSHYSQLTTDSSGQRLLASITQKADPEKSQIVLIEVATRKQAALTPSGDFAEYQWPRFSPAGNKIAYLRRMGQVSPGYPVMALVVEGREIARCENYADHRWVSDSAVLFACQGIMRVLDVDSGQEKGVHQLRSDTVN